MTIECKTVPSKDMLNALPKAFGPQYLAYEMSVYGIMAKLTDNEYKGGSWDYVQLSNGGFFMRLNEADKDKTFHMKNPAAYWEGDLSVEAASLVANLYVSSHLSFQYQDNPKLADNYHQVREYALDLPEAREIAMAID